MNSQRPNDSWQLDRLAEYVLAGIAEVDRLGAEAQHLSRLSAVQTHRIGHALCIARDKTKPRGVWGKWLTKHRIPRTTAWEVTKLYESASEEDVSKLTITEAKVKFGIYPEFMPAEENEEAATVAARSAGTESPERQLVLVCRRLTSVLEQLAEMKWKRDILYAPETDELLEFCQQVVDSIQEHRKRVRKPKKENTKPYLEVLRAA